MKQPLIAPSMLASDFGNLQKEVEMVNNSSADWIHLDIMDGVFVPNISFGIPVVRAINTWAEKPLDVHLMIVQPERYVEKFKDAGASVITVHYEACPHLHRNIQQLKDLDVAAGVSLNPHTPIEVLDDILHDLDMVLIMSVNPGFGGQKFIENSYDKIRRLRKKADDAGLTLKIQVDGGVNHDNARALVDAGVDVLVAGSFVFKSNDPADTIQRLKNV